MAKCSLIKVSGFIYFFILSLIHTTNINADTPEAKNGRLYLNSTTIENQELIKLRGEWACYVNQLLNPGNIDEIGIVNGYFNAPGKFIGAEINGVNLKGKGCVTLRLKLNLDKTYTNFAFKFIDLSSASTVFLNGEKIYASGMPAASKKLSKPGISKGYVYNLPLKKENDLVIQISNHELISGEFEDLIMGKNEAIYNFKSNRSKTDFFLFGSILIMALYHLGIYFIRKENSSALYFGIFCIILAIRTLMVGDKNLPLNITLTWALNKKIEYLSFYLAVPVFLVFTKKVFTKKFSQKILDVFIIIFSMGGLLVLFTPSHIYSHSLNVLQFLTALGGIYVTYVSITSIQRKKTEPLIFLIGWIFLFFTVINDILYDNEIIHTIDNLTSFGLFIFIIFQAYMLASEFARAVTQSEKLAKKLNYTNRNLTNIVNFRTSELEKQKQDLFFQKMETEHKNKDITDSLNYASKIQTAVLPEDKQFKDSFDDFFVLYMPKDIVSGDFYWVKRIRSKIIVAAADCTGHGVPGAFMSLLGIAFLNEIVNMMAYRQESGENIMPNHILDDLRNRIKDSLRQTGNIDDAFDGIDMALCVIDYVEGKLHYSGANNSLYIISSNENTEKLDALCDDPVKINKIANDESSLYEVKANRMPIGTYLNETPFTSHEFSLEDIGYIYMFSDGFSDQLGGENTTKFRQKRFKQLILDSAHQPMEKQYEVLKDTIVNWMDKEVGQIDDITVIGIKIHADREERSFGLF